MHETRPDPFTKHDLTPLLPETRPDFFTPYWWMHAMVAVWTIFALMLFVIEPLRLHRRISHSSSAEQDFANMVRMLQILLALSKVTFFGAVGGSHELF